MGKIRQIELNKDNIRLVDAEFDEKGISFYVETWFDVDKYFGTDTKDDENAWINMYLVWTPSTDKFKATYTINTPYSDEEFDWKLTDDEKKLFKSAIEDYARDFCENATLDEFVTDYELAMLDDTE